MNSLRKILVTLVIVAYGIGFSELSAEYIRAVDERAIR